MTIENRLDLDQLCRDVEIIAQMVEAPVNKAVVKKVLETYQEQFHRGAVAFRTTSRPAGKRELSLRYLDNVSHDPYAMALEHGLLVEEGHPIERLYAESQRYPLMCQGVDIGVSHGIEKIWPMFNVALSVEDLFKFPSMPESVRAYTDYFASYDLKLFTLFALDYYNKSINIYFPIRRPGQYPPERCAAMISDLGFKTPSAEELALNAKTGIIYYTFTWDSPRCERLSFGLPHIPVPSAQFPAHLHPVFERLCNNMPVAASERRASLQTAYLPGGDKDYLKIEVDYTGTIMALLGATIMLVP